MTEWIGGKPRIDTQESGEQQRTWERSVKRLELIMALVALLLSIGGASLAFSNHLAVNDMRLTVLERKTTEYDQLVQRRNDQLNSINMQLATLAATQIAQNEILKQIQEDLRARKESR